MAIGNLLSSLLEYLALPIRIARNGFLLQEGVMILFDLLVAYSNEVGTQSWYDPTSIFILISCYVNKEVKGIAYNTPP